MNRADVVLEAPLVDESLEASFALRSVLLRVGKVGSNVSLQHALLFKLTAANFAFMYRCRLFMLEFDVN